MNLINTNEPDCVCLANKLQRLPRKNLKFWFDYITFNSSQTAYCEIYIKYGSLLSLPDGQTQNIYNGWAATNVSELISESKYNGYVVNSYNSAMNEILAKFNSYIDPHVISKLNFLLTNIKHYLAHGKTPGDIQVAIWKLLHNTVFNNIEHCHLRVETILKDVHKHGRYFIPSKPTDYVAVFLAAANDWKSTDIILDNQLFIIPLTFEQFKPTNLPCTLIEWGTYPAS